MQIDVSIPDRDSGEFQAFLSSSWVRWFAVSIPDRDSGEFQGQLQSDAAQDDVFQSLIGIQGNSKLCWSNSGRKQKPFQSLIGIQGNSKLDQQDVSNLARQVSIPDRDSGEFQAKV